MQLLDAMDAVDVIKRADHVGSDDPAPTPAPRLVIPSPARQRTQPWRQPSRTIELPRPAGPCPFCPDRIRPFSDCVLDGDGQWSAAAVINDFPVGERQHEVLVLARDHDWAPHTADQAELVRTAQFVARRREALLTSGAPWVSAWLSYGALAGSSQPHPHAQVLALPAVPSGVKTEAAHCQGSRCTVCEGLQGARWVAEVDGLGIMAAPFPDFSHELLIAPTDHTDELPEPEALAGALRQSLQALLDFGGRWSYSLVWHAGTPAQRMHAHVHVTLRDTILTAANVLEGWSAPKYDPAQLAAALRPLMTPLRPAACS
jgi:galactose-1-phosphate uridylyltransferase